MFDTAGKCVLDQSWSDGNVCPLSFPFPCTSFLSINFMFRYANHMLSLFTAPLLHFLLVINYVYVFSIYAQTFELTLGYSWWNTKFIGNSGVYILQIIVFWIMTPCCLLNRYWCFGGTWCLLLRVTPCSLVGGYNHFRGICCLHLQDWLDVVIHLLWYMVSQPRRPHWEYSSLWKLKNL
jgi:hypothetical protein